MEIEHRVYDMYQLVGVPGFDSVPLVTRVALRVSSLMYVGVVVSYGVLRFYPVPEEE